MEKAVLSFVRIKKIDMIQFFSVLSYIFHEWKWISYSIHTIHNSSYILTYSKRLRNWWMILEEKCEKIHQLCEKHKKPEKKRCEKFLSRQTLINFTLKAWRNWEKCVFLMGFERFWWRKVYFFFPIYSITCMYM